MGNHQLGIIRICLGRKDQPSIIRRPRVPGIHSACITGDLPRFSSLSRNNVKLAVRLKQHITFSLAEYNPFSVGRILSEIIAKAVSRSTLKRFSFTPPAIIERYTVKIVFKFPAFNKELNTFFLG